jgi:O-succinylbenzoate synthase
MVYRFAWKKYSCPLRPALRNAHGLWEEREGLLVRLEDKTGAAGFGEIAPLPWFGTETLADAAEACRGLTGKTNDAAIAGVPERLGCVRFALAAARMTAPAVAPGRKLAVAALLPAGRKALETLPEKIAEGFLAFKWKVGVDRLEDELGVLDDLLGLLPAYTRLRLDANGGWDRRQAGRWLARCAERPVEFVEQPLAPDDEDGLLGVGSDYPVTLALDESVTGLAAAREWQARGWRGIFVVKPALAGPLEELASWIAETKADVVLSSAVETAVGRAAILRFALAGDLTKRALGFGLGGIFHSRLWDGPVTGPLVDASWCNAVDAEESWNALT